METEDRPILIPQIAGFFSWVESCISILSGWFILFGQAIALVALLTDGAIIASDPWLLNFYGISQAVGVDFMLIGSAYLLARAAKQWNWPAMISNGILVAALGYVAYISGYIFNYIHTFSVSTTAALGALGLDRPTWTAERTGIGVLLVILSGFRRYIPKVAVNVSVQIQAIQDKAQIDAAKRAAQAQNLGGFLQVARQTIAVARGVPTQPSEVVEQPAESIAPETEQVAPGASAAVSAGPQEDVLEANLEEEGFMTTKEVQDYAAKVLHRTISDQEALVLVKNTVGARRRSGGTSGQPWEAPRVALISKVHGVYEQVVGVAR